jgi:VCBS repeat-containing protein
MAVPAKQNLSITRGDTETVVITMTSDGTTPVNITGRTYRAQIRTLKDAGTIDASFTCTVTAGTSGEVTLTMAPASTSALAAGTHYWDLEETASGVVSTILAGTVTVLADVTR